MGEPDKTLRLLIELGVIGRQDAAAVRDLLAQSQDKAIAADQKYLDAVKDAGQSKDLLADQLKRIQEVSAAETEAHVKRLEELDRERIAYMKAHPDRFSETQIAAAEGGQRRKLEAAKNAATGTNIGQTEADIAARQARQRQLEADVKATDDKKKKMGDALAAAQKDQAEASDPKKQKEIQDRIAAAEDVQTRLQSWQGGGINPAMADLVPSAEIDKQQQMKNAAVEEPERNDALAASKEKPARLTKEQADAEDAPSKASEARTAKAGAIQHETSEVNDSWAVQAAKDHQQQIDSVLNAVTTFHGQTVARLSESTGKTNAQIEAMANQIVEGHRSLVVTVRQLMQQLMQQQSQISGQRNSGISG
jgi:hypothetical protein